jgi:hypothetical protein
MAQITLCLDDDTQALVAQAAAADGVSKSRWVAEIIRKHAAHEWPRDCLAATGLFADFPLRDDGNVTLPADVPQVGFEATAVYDAAQARCAVRAAQRACAAMGAQCQVLRGCGQEYPAPHRVTAAATAVVRNTNLDLGKWFSVAKSPQETPHETLLRPRCLFNGPAHRRQRSRHPA